jgi:hypothetical protein
MHSTLTTAQPRDDETSWTAGEQAGRARSKTAGAMFDFAIWAVAPISVEASYRSHMHPPASQLRRRPTILLHRPAISEYSCYIRYVTSIQPALLKDAATLEAHKVRGWTIARGCHKSEM